MPLITKQKQELMVRCITNGQDTIQKLLANGLSQGEIDYMLSPAHSDSVASKEGGKIILNQNGSDLLYDNTLHRRIKSGKEVIYKRELKGDIEGFYITSDGGLLQKYITDGMRCFLENMK